MLILGSASDIDVAKKAVNVLEEMQVAYDIRVASAHRTHGLIKDIMINDTDEIEVFIAIAGLAAHLPGVIASYTNKPVIGVPVEAKLGGLDSLLSCTEMQLGTPVATVGIDRADNAAYIACQIIACNDDRLKKSLEDKRLSYVDKMLSSQEDLINKIGGEYYVKTTHNLKLDEDIEISTDINEDTKVLIISENYSNIDVVHKITGTLNILKIPCDYKVIPSTRNPDKLEKYMKDADENVEIFVAVSAMSTILSGAMVSHTTKPVIGVPCSSHLKGFESLLTMVEMPPGVPTATMGIDAGENAALFIARILSVYDDEVKERLEKFIRTLHKNAYYE